jgi:hypothetical protein
MIMHTVKRKENSQAPISVNELYRPIKDHHSFPYQRRESSNNKYKLLNNFRNFNVPSPSFILHSRKQKPFSEGLIIKMLFSSPSQMNKNTEIRRSVTPSYFKRPHSTAIRKMSSCEDSQRKPISKNISWSINAQKITLSSWLSEKKCRYKVRHAPRGEKLAMSVPKVDYLTGWEE